MHLGFELTCEKQGHIGYYLVERDVRIKGNVEIEDCLPQASDGVPAHCQQKEAERLRKLKIYM